MALGVVVLLLVLVLALAGACAFVAWKMWTLPAAVGLAYRRSSSAAPVFKAVQGLLDILQNVGCEGSRKAFTQFKVQVLKALMATRPIQCSEVMATVEEINSEMVKELQGDKELGQHARAIASQIREVWYAVGKQVCKDGVLNPVKLDHFMTAVYNAVCPDGNDKAWRMCPED